MRMTGFLLGGLCGMVAAAYLAQRRPQALQWVTSATGDMMSGMKEKAIDTALNGKFGAIGKQASGQQTRGQQKGGQQASGQQSSGQGKSGASRTDTKSPGKEPWDTLEQLLDKDPEAKHAASEVMAESDGRTH